ncbi:MAG: Gldg family protein, partial [Clostridia bacterium]|nr:Gldg family protein [Clostridia bacterium]
SEEMYTLSDTAVTRLTETFDKVNAERQAKGQEDVKVDIIFCADPDMLTANEQMRYIYYTALNLQKAFPDTIEVSATNVWANPSAVDAYRSNSYSSIYQSNIIVASGSEFRVTTVKTYFTYDTDSSDEPWAYNGEKKFVQNITAVTKAEAPICGITYNHGEPFDPNAARADQSYSELLNVIENAGYEVQFLNLETEEIPADCRLILTFDPQTDFKTAAQTANGVSELTKLDEFLAKAYSFMVFVDADTPKLKNLEEILEEWGIAFDRYTEAGDPKNIIGNYQIKSDSALDSLGTSVIGVYEGEGMGGSITEDMREIGGSPKVVFGNAMSISYSASYEQTFVLADAEQGIGAFTYGSYYRNNHSRSIFDVFRSNETSVAQVLKDGALLTDENGAPVQADTRGNYKLMTITRESRTIGEGKGYTTVNDASYVCAVGSTEFASNRILGSNAYGNTDLLLETLRAIGKEVEPVGMDFKPLYEDEMTQASASTGEEYYTEKGNTAWTVVLTLIPAVFFAVTGIVLMVRRRVRT